MSSLFSKRGSFWETVVGNERFMNFTGGYDTANSASLSNSSKTSDHRKVGDLVSEEGIELRDYLMISDRCIRCLCCKVK